jgi:NitT/TauT family transport system permease protein
MLFWQLLLGGTGLAAWQLFVKAGWLDRFYFSSPSEIAVRVWELFRGGSVWVHLATTISEATLSFVIGVLIGVAVGFLLGRRAWMARLLDPYLRLANAIPRVVLAPMFLLWFGLGIWSKVALGVTVVFFIVFFNTYQGVRDVSPALINSVRMLGASETQLVRHVLVPSVLTWIFSSLHLSIGFSIIAAVVGEYLGSSRGVGYMIAQSEGVLDTTGVFAGIAILSGLVLVVGAGVARIERRMLRWKPQRVDYAWEMK